MFQKIRQTQDFLVDFLSNKYAPKTFRSQTFDLQKMSKSCHLRLAFNVTVTCV